MEEDDGPVRITLELYDLVPKYLTVEQQCVHCGCFFKESENIGRHMCRVHPGIRLISEIGTSQGGAGTSFYSCCGLLTSVTGRGCLQWDHSTQYLTEDSAEQRLLEIQTCATVVIPHLLMRFITQPLQSSRAYDSKKPRHATCASLDVKFPVLELVEKRNTTAMSLSHTRQIVNWRFEEDCELLVLNQGEQIGTKTFNLVEESRLLWREGKNSPFFTRFFKGGCHSQKTIQGQCDAAWRTQLHNKDDPFAGDDDEQDDYENVPFIIIVRINTQLESTSFRL